MTERVTYTRSEHVATITLSRPEAMNALDLEGWRQLGAAFTAAKDDPDVWVVILTGAGDRAFCAGADLKETIPMITSGEISIADLGDAVLKRVPMWKPIIGAVNGVCVAGGMELLQATDIRIAANHARFGLPEPRWGIVPAGGSLVRLVRQIPYVHAMDLLLTGRQIDADEALAMGIVNRVVPQEDLMATAEAFAQQICENGPLAVQAIKEAVIRLRSVPYDIALDLEPILADRVFRSQDASEGPRAFAEKRRPLFRGR